MYVLSQELYLAFNEVKELSALVSCDNLEVLDLEGNAIDDIAEIQFLASCSTIISLTLEGNPIHSEPGYRKSVLEALPFLGTLDDMDRCVFLPIQHAACVWREQHLP
jgi:Leucine-rich repeat (LRR) protein